MKYKYVFQALFTDRLPVNSETLRNRTDFVFGPLYTGQCAIYTIDVDMWSADQSRPSKIQTLCLFGGDVTECVRAARSRHHEHEILLLALTPNPETSVNGELGSLTLEALELADENASAGTNFYGFDVIDHSGLSALTNIGYSQEEASHLKSRGITINMFGLIESEHDAIAFSALVNQMSEERSEFMPVRILNCETT